MLSRILRPGGVAIVAYINSWGLLRTGIVDFPSWYRDLAVVRSLLGDHVFTGTQLSGFTECYWSTPETARCEIEAASLDIISYSGAEGFAGGLGPLLERLKQDDPVAYENVVAVAAESSELKQYRGATDHLHIVVRKRGEER